VRGSLVRDHPAEHGDVLLEAGVCENGAPELFGWLSWKVEYPNFVMSQTWAT
jgi:hypothetical protein